MGQLANAIEKAASADGSVITEPVLKEAELGLEEIQRRYDPRAIEEWTEEVSKGLPGWSPNVESVLNALKWGAVLGVPAAAIATLLKEHAYRKAEKRRERLTREYMDVEKAKRNLRPPPGTEYPVPIKAASLEKEAGLALPVALVAALLGPAAYKVIKDKLGGIGIGEAFGNLFRTTGDPMTHYLGPPLILGTPIAAAGIASHLADKRLKKLREERMARERQKAESEFRTALEAEYRGAKAASLIENIDRLASVCAGEKASQIAKRFMKKADAGSDPWVEQQARERSWLTGKGQMGLGLWLTAIMLLTGAAGIGAWQYAKKSDKGRKRSKALMRVARRRALATPPTLTAVREEPKKETEETIAEEPV
jgi:hypothetical protein